jgi:hypothetical protein
MTYPSAYSFVSPLTMQEMLAALNAAGPWKWQERENYYFDYLCPMFDEPTPKMRLALDGARYVLWIRYWREGALPHAEFDQILHARIFPAIRAEDIREAEGMD